MSITCLRVERIVLHPQRIVLHVYVLCCALPSCKTEAISHPFLVHTNAQVRIHAVSSFEQAEMRNKKLKKDVEGRSQSVTRGARDDDHHAADRPKRWSTRFLLKNDNK